jgi:hypothetical protein
MVNVPLNDGVAAALSAKAAEQGMTVQAYLEAMILRGPGRPVVRMSPDELDRLLDEGPFALGHVLACRSLYRSRLMACLVDTGAKRTRYLF